MQRLFLLGKREGLNDKDAALTPRLRNIYDLEFGGLLRAQCVRHWYTFAKWPKRFVLGTLFSFASRTG
jgi:hypothetical protein